MQSWQSCMIRAAAVHYKRIHRCNYEKFQAKKRPQPRQHRHPHDSSFCQLRNLRCGNRRRTKRQAKLFSQFFKSTTACGRSRVHGKSELEKKTPNLFTTMEMAHHEKRQHHEPPHETTAERLQPAGRQGAIALCLRFFGTIQQKIWR
jgi:hypothetical protein